MIPVETFCQGRALCMLCYHITPLSWVWGATSKSRFLMPHFFATMLPVCFMGSRCLSGTADGSYFFSIRGSENYNPENDNIPCKLWLEDGLSFWNGPVFGGHVNSRRFSVKFCFPETYGIQWCRYPGVMSVKGTFDFMSQSHWILHETHNV